VNLVRIVSQGLNQHESVEWMQEAAVAAAREGA